MTDFFDRLNRPRSEAVLGFILSLIRQLFERAELVALLARPVDDIAEGGGVVGRDGVEQYNCARMQARGHRVESVLLAFCVVDIPVGVGY